MKRMKTLIDSLKNMVDRVRTTLQKTKLNIRQKISLFLVYLIKHLNAKKYPVYIGKIERAKIDYTSVKNNLIVITDDGFGKLKNNSSRLPIYNPLTNKVFVLLNETSHSKEYPKDHVFTLEVVDNESYIGYPLHPYFYKYVVHAIGETIQYHVSKENNALLSKREVDRLALIAVINSANGGTKLLRRLRKHKLLNFLNL